MRKCEMEWCANACEMCGAKRRDRWWKREVCGAKRQDGWCGIARWMVRKSEMEWCVNARWGCAFTYTVAPESVQDDVA